MSARTTDEHCHCGHRLRTPLELESGLCWMCLYRENEEEIIPPADEEEESSEYDGGNK